MAAQWNIAFRGTISGQYIMGAGIAWYLLGRRKEGWAYPVLFMFSPGYSFQLSATPYAYGPYSYFQTPADNLDDFNSWGAMAFARFWTGCRSRPRGSLPGRRWMH